MSKPRTVWIIYIRSDNGKSLSGEYEVWDDVELGGIMTDFEELVGKELGKEPSKLIFTRNPTGAEGDDRIVRPERTPMDLHRKHDIQLEAHDE
jgi:hypothetical protein